MSWDIDEIKNINEVIRRGMYWAEGPEIVKFEKRISDIIDSKYVVVVNSGTSALHLALLSLNIGKGDEIIVPAFTFIATANSALFVNATPVFADIEKETLGLDPMHIEDLITERTKAIIPIHYAGIPCKIHEIKKIAKRHGLYLIEDAAEAFMAKSQSKYVGTIGHVGIFSFCQTKVITTGEGGAIVTHSKALQKKLRLLRSHGRSSKNYFFSYSADYTSFGYNFRMSPIQAALGLAQLKKAKKLIRRRREIAKIYREGLESINGVDIPMERRGDYAVYQMFSFLVKNKKIRNRLCKYLKNKGVMTKIYFEPVYKTAFYRSLGFKVSLPNTEYVSERILTIPLYPALKDDEVSYIIKHIVRFLKNTN